MPRTPLLQHILRAASVAREASTRGISTEQVLAEHHAHRVRTLSRREFVAITAIGGALAACDRADRLTGVLTPRPSDATSQSGPRVAIVGAGLAGLTCAFRLRQSGISATVYEGSARLGGRCWTRRGDFSGGQIAEHGGELIDQGHTEVRQLAQELGLDLDNLVRAEPNDTEPFYYYGGAPYGFAEATNDIKAIWQVVHNDLSAAGYPTLYNSYTPQGWALDHLSLADWIEQKIPGGRTSRLGALLETAYVIEYGADAELQSSLNLIYLLGFSGQGQLRIFGPSNEKYHVRGGNDLIVQRLTSALDSAQIVTDAPLLAIARTPGGAYALTFGRGNGRQTVTVDHVVLTVPFAVMRSSVDYSAAGFNPVKLNAITNLAMGANAKLNVQFSRRHWNSLGCNGDTYADTGYQNTWEVTRAQSGSAGILVDYTGGSPALALGGKSAATLATQFISRIGPVLPGIGAHYNGKATIDWWPGNPWTLGSYSYWKVGQYTSFAGAEGERSGNCHFAGEHTSIDSQGYLNGAVESGERVASEILADVKKA